ncbi:endolytic transglycosylase MltG [Pantoea sp. Mhis]|uniref:endolytic transglycosylase MltG n=1 Tax=Pantoea sp. Mhis TaxID=2576759 RepID=UPI00135BE894|nr:endolytic transglycosylase MltG [Pantoea sp. Mhis]MXP56310.1 endolytic transglycosylase MltG [Pantoea sp. Mhis]
MIIIKNIFFIFTVIICIVITFVYWQVKHIANTPLTLQVKTIYTIPVGINCIKLIKQLETKHIIPHNIWFYQFLKLKLQWSKIKAGTYCLNSSMNINQLLNLFINGQEAQFSIRFVNGSCLKEWLKELRFAPYIKHTLTNDPLSTISLMFKINENQLEGAFYPDTYFYTANTSDIVLLKHAHIRMKKISDTIWHNRMKTLPYTKKEDMITIASIIEKETSINKERRIVSSVFVNRLYAGMKLQADSTVIYGMGNNYNGFLTHKDLQKTNNYNTYKIRGLPIGPIAMPSKESLEAAAHPETTNYFYFVANGKGGHTFSKNLTDHKKAIHLYQLVIKKNK